MTLIALCFLTIKLLCDYPRIKARFTLLLPKADPAYTLLVLLAYWVAFATCIISIAINFEKI